LQNDEITNIIEAILYASEEELTVKQISEILLSFKIDLKPAEIEESIEKLNESYTANDNSFEIIKIAGGYQFATKARYAHFVGKLRTETQKKKLSQSALETLAIIAYKQPITRSNIEFIRGVNVDYIVNSLLERDLITIMGRAKSPGRPILYGTTKNFLKVLGMNSLEDLPRLKEINEILKTEKIEGITEADIDLFNSMNNPEALKNNAAEEMIQNTEQEKDTEQTEKDEKELKDRDDDRTGEIGSNTLFSNN